MNTYLLPIADRDPLTWIVAEQRTAFSAHRQREAERLARGDRLLLYTTRGCFRNPTRDRGQIIGIATVTGEAATLPEPVRFGHRAYPVGLDFRIERLAAPHEGLELAPLVPRLSSFPDPRAWSGRMRRALVPLTDEDARRLVKQIGKIAPPYPRTLRKYAV